MYDKPQSSIINRSQFQELGVCVGKVAIHQDIGDESDDGASSGGWWWLNWNEVGGRRQVPSNAFLGHSWMVGLLVKSSLAFYCTVL